MMRHHEANFKHIFGESVEDMMAIEDKQRAMDRAWDEMMDPRMDYD